ncbi:hypothetical protein JXZ92_01270 [Mycoplasma sp. CSL10137]|uniref:hypothetical protein n=1 Tax=unclassified Mycoplasma TaxID=2683645 RepID=UPI00197C1D2B|nr:MULTISPECIES: hypothetical protein [unclassified Mycoplasma]MBN4083450.1 hypothetical protein [Mycoplasma sp. CSL10137]MBN4084619.1 hypothetical protein [Mycoplasma sp. CSL10166]MBU4693097.1 hypothetical protein [Mycoplasma sp. CSL7491-lung]
MKLKFLSLINQNGESNKIQFEVECKLNVNGKFTSFEFIDPQSKEKNLIEISEDEINIFSSSASIFLKYNQKIKFDYEIENQILPLSSKWTNKDFSKNKYNFTYSLSSSDFEIGTYQISIEIIRD